MTKIKIRSARRKHQELAQHKLTKT